VSDGELIRELSDSDKPLCPNIGQPINAAHALRNRMLNAFYEAAEKNTDGDMTEPVDKAYYAAAYGFTTSDRMNLYRDSASFVRGREIVVVEAWYFRCGICGLILPASRRES
jgi:hypothetical protein